MNEALIKEFTPYPHTGWKVIEELRLTPLPARTLVNDGEAGKGVHSVVYFGLDRVTNQRYVVKAGNNNNFPALHNVVAKHGLAPQIYLQLKLENNEAGKILYLVIMDAIKMTLSKYFSSALHFNVQHVFHALKCLCAKKLLINFFHGDFHTQNIVFLMDGSLGVIDFEFARAEHLRMGCVDFIPLISDLKFSFGERQRELAELLLEYVNFLYNAQFQLRRFERRLHGGFDYHGATHLFDSYSTQYTMEDMRREFPHYQLPLIEE